MKRIIGIDIGGTTVKIGILKITGDLECKWEIPTDKSDEGQSIVRQICQSIENRIDELFIQKQHIMGIGIGAPGFIEAESGLIYEAVNIGWKNVELTKQVQDILGLPAFLENDANVAVLGENWLGAGNQNKNVLAVTLGTGVGGGIISGGKVLNGANGTAGEIGHMTVEPDGDLCNCGRKGCLETIASATGMVRQAMEMIKKHPTSLLAKRYHKQNKITAKDIFELEKHDEAASNIIRYTTNVLGMSLANVAAVLNPSKIIIGGGVSKAGDQLLSRIKVGFSKFALPRINDVCELKIACLGNDAGIIGAAFLVKQRMEDVKF